MKTKEIIEKLEKFLEEFDPSETKVPTEDDLDDLYDAIETLNKAEWFVNNNKDVNILVKAQKILQSILDEHK